MYCTVGQALSNSLVKFEPYKLQLVMIRSIHFTFVFRSSPSRMINSDRFSGLDWLDEDKTVFKVPWIHAKKRGYNRERDAALFREWAMHSGKYRQDSDPTVWKINFRCAINGLKDIMEIKDMQTEDCRVYKVLPSRSKRRRPKVARQRAEPYPTAYTTGAEGKEKILL